jgi:hypothetical protein
METALLIILLSTAAVSLSSSQLQVLANIESTSIMGARNA